MKRMMVAMLGAVLVSAVGMYAQAQPATQGAVYIGCLVPGSSANAFKLINATEKGQKGKDKVNFNVVEENEKVDVMHFVTMEVEITGTVSGTTLTASKIKRRSDYCG